MGFQKGEGGRKPGSQNHLTKTVKETVLAVFNDLQADKKNSLKAFATKYPRDFYQIAAKLIPTDIKADIKLTKVSLEIVRNNSITPTHTASTTTNGINGSEAV